MYELTVQCSDGSQLAAIIQTLRTYETVTDAEFRYINTTGDNPNGKE